MDYAAIPAASDDGPGTTSDDNERGHAVAAPIPCILLIAINHAAIPAASDDGPGATSDDMKAHTQ
jgi:hypothetical protein